MAFDFPNAPTLGQVYNGYTWDNEKWVAAAAVAAGAITPSNGNPLMDGAVAPGTSLLYSRGDHVHPIDISRAPLSSPAFIGNPTAPTPTAGDNDTSLATTAFVAAAIAAGGSARVTTSDTPPVGATDGDLWWESDTAILYVYYDDGSSSQWVSIAGGALPSSATPLMDGIAAPGTAVTFARGDHRHPSDTSLAPLGSPAFTGTISINGSAFATNYTGFTRLYKGDGTDQGIALGSGADPTNYYFSTYHTFLDAAGSTTYATLSAGSSYFNGNAVIQGVLSVVTGHELGSTVASTPFIDFHSSGNANDYDARIVASGGTATAGAATLAFVCGALTGPTPTAGDNSTKLATTAFVAAAGGGSSFVQAGAGAVTRTMQNKARDWINVRDFGAVGNGTTDDTNAIQLAINYAASLGGAQVYLGPGSFKISSALWIHDSGVSLIGAGRNATYLRPSVANQISILIGSNAPSTIQGVAIADMQIYPSVTPTDGAGIYVQGNLTNVWISGVIFQQTWHGITFDSYGAASQYNIDNCYFQTQPGTALTLGSSNGLLQDVFVARCIFGLCNRGIACDNVSGFYINDIDLILCNASIIFEPAAGQSAIFGLFNNVLADSTQGTGWSAPGTAGKVGGISCNNCWAAASTSAGQAGIYLNGANVNGFSWTGGQIRANQRHGMLISGGVKNVVVSSSQIFCNGGLTSNTYHGIAVSTGCQDITIIGNRIGLGGYDALAGAGNAQAYGVFVDAGTNNIIVTNNNCLQNGLGGIRDASGGITKLINNNLGTVV